MPCGVLVLEPGRAHRHDQPGRPQAAGAGNAAHRKPADLSAFSQIDFESLGKSSDWTASTSSCAPMADSVIAGWRSATASWTRRLIPRVIRMSLRARESLKSIWILRDITANKQAEQEREAARSATALAEISTILAHEIRNPLASMELFAGLIAEEPERGRAVDFASPRRNPHALRNREQRPEPQRRVQTALDSGSPDSLH